MNASHSRPASSRRTSVAALASRVACPSRRAAARVLFVLSLAGAMGSLAVVGCMTLPRSLPTLAVMGTVTEPTGEDAARWLATAGITPKRLAAAEVGSNDIGGIFTAARSHLSEHMATLESAESSLSAARSTAQTLTARVQAGLASVQEAEGLPAAQTALASAQSAMDTALGSFRTSALAGLSSEERAALANLRANQQWGLPAPYLTVNRTEEQWIALRDALAHKRIQTARGAEVEGAASSLVSAANQDVASSLAAYDANLSPIRTAWATAAGGE